MLLQNRPLAAVSAIVAANSASAPCRQVDPFYDSAPRCGEACGQAWIAPNLETGSAKNHDTILVIGLDVGKGLGGMVNRAPA
jgi:hypothetical protein